ncbi:MAG TPA: STAS domain-containing protein [Oligoflexus sp.]|uniref:STAS domain-containing protein n=1 Tax=Oligoflexus sp. TaxID=1971216 RepID=UPI002D7E731C|nr:STAS domain-containing protein [Oligoflexus sp.]HET9235921.1 STAS domain-containing protein [Oligoflexus sp.]
MQQKNPFGDVLKKHETDILTDWIKAQLDGQRSPMTRMGLVREAEVRELCKNFLRIFIQGLQNNSNLDTRSREWNELKEMMSTFSRDHALQGYTPSETASFIFLLKKPLLARIGQELAKNSDDLYQAIWAANEWIDALGLTTMEYFQKGREELINRQQQEMLELSTPVVKLWDGILALPVIGTLDSARAQAVMESLLTTIMETGSKIAIIDITGVPTVDTVVAQHLMKTVAAARLMGADCIISGIRPQIAQTIVHLAIDLGGISTKATLADAFRLAMQRVGMNIVSQSVRV